MSKNLSEILSRSREIMDTVGDRTPSQERPNKTVVEQSLYASMGGVAENFSVDAEQSYIDEAKSTISTSRSTKLPPEIANSFASTPYMGKLVSQDQVTGSVLDNIDEGMIRPRPSAIKRPAASPIVSTNNSIDYGVIKALIDESIKRNLQEMRGQLLTESNEKPLITRFYANNNKIQVIDGENVYEGKVEFKGKLKKKK